MESKTRKSSQHQVLVIEDNDDDFECVETALKEKESLFEIIRCENGIEAVDFIKQEEKQNTSSVTLVLLDLNLPGVSGLEVLNNLRASDIFKIIPTVIISTSSDEKDIKSCYQARANAYIIKPDDINEYIDIVQKTYDYWLETVNCTSSKQVLGV